MLALTAVPVSPHVARLDGDFDFTRLCGLVEDGRLTAGIEFEGSWRQAGAAIDALLDRRVGGKAVLHVD